MLLQVSHSMNELCAGGPWQWNMLTGRFLCAWQFPRLAIRQGPMRPRKNAQLQPLSSSMRLCQHLHCIQPAVSAALRRDALRFTARPATGGTFCLVGSTVTWAGRTGVMNLMNHSHLMRTSLQTITATKIIMYSQDFVRR